MLRLIGERQPLLMLSGSDDGYGTRWTLGGQQVQPGNARFLMDGGLVSERGWTEFGARRLLLTAAGVSFRDSGIAWWRGLSWWEKLGVVVLG